MTALDAINSIAAVPKPDRLHLVQIMSMKNSILLAAALCLVVSAHAAPPKIPSEVELRAMTLESLLDFNKSVQAADFTILYDSLSKIWQDQTTPAKLKSLFQSFIDKEVDISPIKKVEPVFNKPAEIDSDEVLIVRGYYPTKPKRVIFQLKYYSENSDWKLVGIKIDIDD